MASPIPNVEDAATSVNSLVAWLENQPDASSEELAQAVFDRLLENASQSRVSSVGACTKLCGFVQQCSRSSKPLVRGWAFKEDTSLRLLDFYIEWNERDQHRSMKLVLEVLALLIIKNPDPRASKSIKSDILPTLVSIINRQSTRPLVKSSMTALNYLLTKSVWNLEDVSAAYKSTQSSPSVPATEPSDLTLWQSFVRDTISWMGLHYVCTAAGRLLVTVFRLLQESHICGPGDSQNNSGFSVEAWFQWLEDGLSALRDVDILESIKLYFLIPLFKSDRPASLQLLESLNQLQPFASGVGQDLSYAASLRLAALEVGKKSGLVEDPSTDLSGKPSKAIVLNEQILDSVLGHSSHEIRSSALSVLVSSQSPARPFSPGAFDLLRKYLPGYHSEPDAKFRNELFGHTKTMTKRLKTTIGLMQRLLPQPENAPGSKQPTSKRPAKDQAGLTSLTDVALVRETLERHEAFLTWYLNFLRSELVPTASYQRHFTALRAVDSILKQPREISGPVDVLEPALGARVFGDQAWVRCILDLIMDPFDDVRATATSLLMLCSPKVAKIPVFAGGKKTAGRLKDVLGKFCIRASELASRTGRANHADGAARAQGLLYSWQESVDERMFVLSDVLNKLETKLRKAERDLGGAAIENPIHGDFAAVRYIWEVLRKGKCEEDEAEDLFLFQDTIAGSCRRVWQVVKDVLCDDSPEGHLPQDLEEMEGLESRDLLSYSFRAIHESSNTIRTIMSPVRFVGRTEGALVLSPEFFKEAGSLAFEQLASLRHRGALSSVSQTFIVCCQATQDPAVTLPNKKGSKALLTTWFKGALKCISNEESTTRRSAGIPALMTGVLAANATKPSFDEVMKTLAEIASQPAYVSETDDSKLPQVHALNCLRDVFRSSLLGKRAERYLPECLELAANCLKSEVWAIRNCGLLLLRSLMDLLLGTGESKAEIESGWDGKTIRISYAKYHALPVTLLGLLRSSQGATDVETQQRAAESVFPALDIVRRAGPPDAYRDELYGAIAEYLGSHLWHVREMAARTICSFLICEDWVAELDKLLRASMESSNRLHGTLLSAKFLLERLADTEPEGLQAKIQPFLSVLDGLGHDHRLILCAEVQAAYLEVLNTIAQLTPGNLPEVIKTGNVHDELDDSSERNPPSALLRTQRAIRTAHKAAAAQDRCLLRQTMLTLAKSDVDTATKLLEALPGLWPAQNDPDTASWLCIVYMDTCAQTDAAGVRTPALANLADVMDHLLGVGRADLLPASDVLESFWASLSRDTLNPALSCAVLRMSGPVMALQVLRGSKSESGEENKQRRPSASLEAKLRAWGAMLADAGDADNGFDTRYAAVAGLRSFTAALKSVSKSSPAFLPILLALYDALNDDDDEIRDLAAETARDVFSTPATHSPSSPVPASAVSALLPWITAHFGHLAEFRAEAVRRMVGCAKTPSTFSGGAATIRWEPAESQLERAMRFDASLFQVEEQNLFVDEVRETERWVGVFASLPPCIAADGGGKKEDEKWRAELRRWLVAGTWALVRLTILAGLKGGKGGEDGDGPLGWTSTPEVFAICSRVILGARALAATSASSAGAGSNSDVATAALLMGLLSKFRAAGVRTRVHGLLLSMAELG